MAKNGACTRQKCAKNTVFCFKTIFFLHFMLFFPPRTLPPNSPQSDQKYSMQFLSKQPSKHFMAHTYSFLPHPIPNFFTQFKNVSFVVPPFHSIPNNQTTSKFPLFIHLSNSVHHTSTSVPPFIIHICETFWLPFDLPLCSSRTFSPPFPHSNPNE